MHYPFLLPRFKRVYLQILLALTGWTALAIAYAIYIGGWLPDNLAWALGTVLAQAFLMLASFAAFSALDKARTRLLAIAGMILAMVILALLPVFAWIQMTDHSHEFPIAQMARDPLTQLAASSVLTAGLICLIPFILLPQMRGVGRIAQWTTIVYSSFAYLAAILYLWHIDTYRIDESLSLLIPAGACMFCMFIMHKFLAIRVGDAVTAAAAVSYVRCPRCACGQEVAIGTETRCRKCRLRMTMQVEEPRCPNCNFNIYKLIRPVCPECGFHLDVQDIQAPSGEGAAGRLPGVSPGEGVSVSPVHSTSATPSQ